MLEQRQEDNRPIHVDIVKIEEVELDEMWRFVGKKSNQWWLWHAIEHHRHEILAYHVGQRTDKAFQALQQTLKCFDSDFYFTDDWGAYERNLPRQKHLIGKNNTQAIERKHLTLQTRIKRLARRTICFSTLEKMHDIVIGLFINRYEFGLVIS